MKRFVVGLAALVLLFNEGHALGAVVYTTLDVPGSIRTYASGIDGSNVVGFYDDSSHVGHGFLYDGSTYTTLHVPRSTQTTARAIDGSNVVGYYVDSSSVWHGFLYDGSTYTTLDPPESHPTYPFTRAVAIDGGNVVGFYRDDSYNFHGFLASEAPSGIVPEPSTIFVWSLLAAIGFLWYRRR